MLEKPIFLSYASDDRVRARFVVQSLEERGWSVWWDTRDIPPGDRFSRVIDDAISGSNVIVVLWSRRSVDSDWVLDEASDGKKRGILVPVLIDDVEIPRGSVGSGSFSMHVSSISTARRTIRSSKNFFMPFSGSRLHSDAISPTHNGTHRPRKEASLRSPPNDGHQVLPSNHLP